MHLSTKRDSRCGPCAGDEAALCARLQVGILNFYPADGLQPFVPLAAAGPWLVTAHGWARQILLATSCDAISLK